MIRPCAAWAKRSARFFQADRKGAGGMKGHTLPRFIIFGAVKAATTWLTYQLQQNTAVYLPDPEPHYFSSEFHRGLSWYGEFFRGAAPGQLPGAKSADYLAHRTVEQTSELQSLTRISY